MSLRILPNMEQRSPEWYDQRRGMVTASAVGQLVSTRHYGAIDYTCPDCDAPANAPCRSKVKKAGVAATDIKTVHSARTDVAHANRDTSPLIVEAVESDYSRALTAVLTAERITGHTDPNYESFNMLRGIDDEPRARAVYAENCTDQPVTQVGFMVRDDWGFELGYSPDGMVGDDGLIEIKSRLQKKQLQTVLSDEVPTINMAQCQAGLMVSGREWIDYVSYSGGMHLWTKRVYPDPVWQDAIVRAVRNFERASEDMTSKYLAAVEGLPMTERIDYDQELSL